MSPMSPLSNWQRASLHAQVVAEAYQLLLPRETCSSKQAFSLPKNIPFLSEFGSCFCLGFSCFGVFAVCNWVCDPVRTMAPGHLVGHLYKEASRSRSSVAEESHRREAIQQRHGLNKPYGHIAADRCSGHCGERVSIRLQVSSRRLTKTHIFPG